MKKTPCLKFPVREEPSKDGNGMNHNRIRIWAGVHQLMSTWKRNPAIEGMMGLSKKKLWGLATPFANRF
jgi:hypothetical protein